MRRHLQNAALLIASLIFGIILIEIGLRLLTPFPITKTSNKKEDSRLGYTMSRALEDIDERGFRNTHYTLEEADLVIIGDSHAYGYNVASEDNFPSILASKTERKVYNLGVGSYGIYQYKILIDDIPQYSAKDVILALYPANDLSFHCTVLRAEYWRNYIKDTGLTVPDCNKSNLLNQQITVKRILGGLKRRLSETATLQIIKNLRQSMSDQDLGVGGFVEEKFYWFDENQFVNKYRVRSHALATSLEEPDVRTNFENSKTFLIEGKRILADASVGFVVVIIPSKERVLYEWMTGRNREVPADFVGFVKNENFITREYKSFFESNNILYVDALSDVVSSLDRTLREGAKFYKDGNGHPYRPGYEAYSDTAVEALELVRETAN